LSLGAALAAVLAALPQTGPEPGAPPRPGPARDREIAAIQQRAAAAAPGSPAAAKAAHELGRLGAAYLAEGSVDRATELLSEAYALDEEDGVVLAQLTLCYVRAGDYETSHFYLLRAEERAARAPPEIWAVLGDVYLDLHRLDDAVLAWSECVRLGGGDPALLRRLARARDELALSRGQRSIAFDHFTIFADPSVSEELVRLAGQDLEAAYAVQAPLLGARLAAPQLVVLYAGRDYFSLVSVPDWGSGLFDGKIRVSVESESVAPGSARAVLWHELAHALIRARASDRVPGWFHEGLAQWCEGRRIPVRDVRVAVGPHPAWSFGALDGGFGRALPRAVARASYAQALSIVEYLIAARGVGAITCTLARLSDSGGAFEDALRAETGLSEKDLLAAWKRWAGV
jgi:tetratricopeptide (TPR) repeat protein